MTQAMTFQKFQTLQQPGDLYEIARAFVAGTDVRNPSFGANFINLSARWGSLLASVKPPLHLTLFRCLNSALESFHPSYRQLLQQSPVIAMALLGARTSRMDLRTAPGGSPMELYCYYASIAETFGSTAVKSAIAGGSLTLLGIRRTTSTLVNNGRGAYDDTMVVLKGIGAFRTHAVFPLCTEPTAQYSQRAAPKPGGKKGERVDDRYKDVKYRHTEGVDLDPPAPRGEGIMDLGRLQEGTYQYTEKDGGHLKARAFKVGSRDRRNKYVLGPVQAAERDTDGDGFFNEQRIDPSGADRTMYIHIGGKDTNAAPNTDSAGCQTIPGNHYPNFLMHIPKNSVFHYVLVNAL